MLVEVFYLHLQSSSATFMLLVRKEAKFDLLRKIVKYFFILKHFFNKINKTLKRLSEILIFTPSKLFSPFSFVRYIHDFDNKRRTMSSDKYHHEELFLLL